MKRKTTTPLGRTPMKSTLFAPICLAVLCITLSLGLWPFYAPPNDLSWRDHPNGLSFGKYSTAFSSRSLPTPAPLEATVEISLIPRRIWDSGAFLSFYHPDRSQFLLRQTQTDLMLETTAPNTPSPEAWLYVDDLFRPRRPVFLTVTAGLQGTHIYLDGLPAKTAPSFPLSGADFTGRLILGDSAGQTSHWRGDLFGLAIYHRQFAPEDVRRSYAAWKEQGRPQTRPEDRMVGLYLFDERAGTLIHDRSGTNVHLEIPPRYTILDKIALEPVWSEFSMTRSYWSAALKNIVGFIPFGFCFYAYLGTHLQIKRPRLLTILLGTVVSLTIEILQAYLPTRDSGTTDLITNALGTWLGVIAYSVLAPVLRPLLAWSPPDR